MASRDCDTFTATGKMLSGLSGWGGGGFFVLRGWGFRQEVEVVEGEVVVPPFDFEAALKVFSGGWIIASVDLVPSHVVQDFVLVGLVCGL